MNIAVKKRSDKDYVGAKKFVNKAKSLYPKLDNLEQVLIMIDVYVSASKNGKGEADWYEILGVDPLADDETVKKQYKKLALLLHPDKNRFSGAEEAFKLVLDAWHLLSDKVKRIAYDQKRKSKEVKQKKTEPKPQHETASCNNVNRNAKEEASSKQKKVSSTFWTMCDGCKTYCELVRANHLKKISPCPYCRKIFVAIERFPEMRNGKPFVRFSFSHKQEQQSSVNSQATRKSTSHASSTTSASDSVNDANQAKERVKKWFEKAQENLAAGVAAASANQAQESIKKWYEKARENVAAGVAAAAANQSQERSKRGLEEAQENANEVERPLKKPMTTRNTNSTHEAERPSKRPRTTWKSKIDFRSRKAFQQDVK